MTPRASAPIDVEEYEALDFHCGTTFENPPKPNDGIMRICAPMTAARGMWDPSDNAR